MKGDYGVFPDDTNICLWAGMSQEFTEFVEVLRPHLELAPAPPLVFLAAGGGYLDLPIAKEHRQYKKPHWVPVWITVAKKVAA